MIRPLLCFVLIAATVTVARAPAWSAASAQDRAAPAQDHEESAIAQSMEKMKGALRRMDRALEGGDTAAALPLVAEFQAAVVTAKSEVPERAGTVEEAERAAFVNDYRSTMVKLLKASCEFEVALIEDRADDAKKILASDMKALQKPSHQRFRVERDERERREH